MAQQKTRKYARIADYGDLLMPLEVFERFADKLYIVRTSYEDGVDSLVEIKQPDSLKLHSVDEVENLLMHSKLSKS